MNYAESYSDRIRQNQSECQKSRCTGDVPYTVGFLVDFRYLHMALRWQVEHVNAQVLEELHQKGRPRAAASLCCEVDPGQVRPEGHGHGGMALGMEIAHVKST